MQENWSWVGNWSEKRAILCPNKLAIIDNIEKREYSFLQMDKRANRVANYLNSLGLQKGDRIGIISKNRIEMVDLFNATGKIGLILVPFNVRLATNEIKYLLNLVKPKLMLYDETFDSKLFDVSKEFPNISYIPFLDSQSANFTNLINKFSDQFYKTIVLNFDDPHLILFTG